MKRRNFLLFTFIITSSFLKGQNDTVFLTGTSRFYGDSLVLRWNGRTLQSFNALQKIPLVVETLNPVGRWVQLAQQNAVQVNRWYLNKSPALRNRLLAAGLLQQFQTESKRPVNGDEELQQRQENLKYLWLNLSLTADLDAFVAEACNLRHTILNPPQNSVSQYRIFSAHPLYFSDTLFFVVAPQRFTAESLPAPAATEQDGAVSLRWKTDRSYTAYYVEKAAPGSGTWTRINTAPLVIPAGQQELFYTDSVQNYVPSEYRISGIDLFGDATLPGAAVKAMGRDRTPPPVLSGFRLKETPDNHIVLSWDKSLPLNGEAGIAIGMKHEGPDAYIPLFNKLKPMTTTSFTIPVKPGISNYYFVLQVFDTAGNSSSSEAFIQLEDNTAPAKPEGLRAIVNDSGIVTLR
ncbi:MAG: hypothetical protein KJS92_04195, partial [Bacteroidetes bacterium]|nr:hypothetical protein [Bacteroidota bacterium]